MTEIRMPRLGEAMTEGYLIEFYKTSGDTVQAGEPLYRVETAKSESDIEAPVTGVLTLVAECEQEYPIGELLATIEPS
jgi:pyruvate/2-oxoglutarate dehydrogenase complex dihydrolipoamide acyltransferase (E2) component